MNRQRPIGFLDSGIGGITVLKKAVELLPNENYFFFSDSANNSYGDKSDGEIISRCTEIVNCLTVQKDCKAIVIACNTASAKAVKSLRANFDKIPIIAIEPAYKMVHDLRPKGATLIMATKGTISSEKFRRLYYSYYNHNTVIHSCVGLADLIEQGRDKEICDYLEKNLARYKGRAENVVLGCTHYPLIKAQIRKTLGDVTFFDGADGVSKRLKFLLEESNMLSDNQNGGEIEFCDSSPDDDMKKAKKERFFKLLNEDNI
ncbi:MAG: glutamate racemase [Clostridiales bacterium]|nr:glutamate racemase [Clostridiales bacterium]